MAYYDNMNWNWNAGNIPLQNPLNNITFQSPLTKQEVVRVHGKDGASAYPLAPNSSVLLLDETQPVIWCKMTDGAGFPTLKPFAYSEIGDESTNVVDSKAADLVTKDDFDKLSGTVKSLNNSVERLLKEFDDDKSNS